MVKKRASHCPCSLVVTAPLDMTHSSNVKVSSFANIVDMAVEGQSFIKCDSKDLELLTVLETAIEVSPRVMHTDSTRLSIPGTGTDYDDLWFVWIEGKAILREPAVDGTGAFVQPQYSVAVPQLCVELGIVRVMGVMDPERWYGWIAWHITLPYSDKTGHISYYIVLKVSKLNKSLYHGQLAWHISTVVKELDIALYHGQRAWHISLP